MRRLPSSAYRFALGLCAFLIAGGAASGATVAVPNVVGRPARHRTRLHLAEELFRAGVLTRQQLRARWEAIRDEPGPFDPATDETRDLVRAARAVGVLTEEEAAALAPRAGG